MEYPTSEFSLYTHELLGYLIPCPRNYSGQYNKCDICRDMMERLDTAISKKVAPVIRDA